MHRKRLIFAIPLVLLGAAVLAGAAAPPAPVVSGPLGEKIDTYMSRLEGFGFAGSLLVAKDGKVVVHKGYGLANQEKKVPFTAETVFDIGSITKQFTAAAILKLEMAGKLKVTDPITKHFDGVPPDKQGITLHHLLTHSAGLEDVFGGDYEEMPRDELVKKAFASKLLWAPGTRYEYSNAGYSLLTAVVEKVSGQPYETFLRENLFKPAGMEKTGYRLAKWAPEDLAHGYEAEGHWGTPLDHPWAPDGPWWNLRGNGGILSTVGDLYKWHQALEGEKILSKEAKAKLFTPHVPEDEEGSSHYGYGWAIFKTSRNTRLIAHNGGNGIFAADFRRYVDENVVLIIGSNQSDFSSIAVSGQLPKIVFGVDYTLPPAVARVDPAVLARYAGTYVLPSGGRLQVTSAPPGPGGSPRLSVAAEGVDAFAALAGGNPADRERYAALEKKIVQATEQARKGNYVPLHEVFGVNRPLEEVAELTKGTFRRMEERLGPLRSVEVLGSAPRGAGIATYLRFQHEKGSRVFEYLWQGPVIANVAILDELPADLFLPASERELVSFNLRTQSAKRIGFELSPDGKVQALVVRTPGGEVKANRMG